MDDKRDASRCPKAGPSHRTGHEGSLSLHRHGLWFVKCGGSGLWCGFDAQSEPAAQGIVLQPMTP